MLADLWDIIIIVSMILVALLPVFIIVRFGLWSWERGQQLVVWWQERQADVLRQRMDVQLVTLHPGEVKISRDELSAVVRAQIEMTMQRTDALRLPANVPHTITHNPHYSPTFRNDNRPVAQLAEPVGNLVSDRIPNAMECYAQGWFDDPDQLMIGINPNAQPIYSPVEDTFAIAVAGVPKMGKTTGMRLLAVQMALHGAQMAIIDPAANSASQQGLAADLSGLRAHLWEQPAAIPDDAIKMLKRIEAVGIARNRGQDTSTWPLMVMIDELTSLVTGERGDEIADMILRINRQFRKERIFTIAAGQDWLGYALGGDAGLRRAFVCKAVYRIDSDNGRKLSVRKPLVDMVPSLQRGQMVWVDAFANQSLVSVPDCSAACVRAILGDSEPQRKDFYTGKDLLTDGSGSSFEAHRSAVEGGVEVDGEVTIEPGKMRQIKDYGAQGWSTHKIVSTVFGVKGGSSYGNARELVNGVLGREI